MGELGKRVITALLLVALAWGWYFRLPSPWFETVLIVIGWAASCELILMVQLRASKLYMLSSLLLWVLFLKAPSLLWLPLMLLIWFALFAISERDGEAPFARFFAMAWLFSWLYLFVAAVANTHDSEAGRSLVIGAAVAIWVSDIAAYFVGRALGRRKLCPAISPGKSVEGALGALLAAMPVALLFWIEGEVLPIILLLPLAITVIVAGILGDLSESAVKRLVGVKDSGRWLPGHGGILDRVDAMLMAVPVAWVVWEAVR